MSAAILSCSLCMIAYDVMKKANVSLVQVYTTSHEPSLLPTLYNQQGSSTRSSHLKQNKYFCCTDMDMNRTTTQSLQMQISAHFEANLHLCCGPSRLLAPASLGQWSIHPYFPKMSKGAVVQLQNDKHTSARKCKWLEQQLHLKFKKHPLATDFC